MSSVNPLQAIDLKKKLDNREDIFLLYVRQPWEFSLAAIEGSENFPQSEVIDRQQEFVFEEFDLSGESKRRWSNLLLLRWTPHGEMIHLLERSGFQVYALYGDFSGGPYVGYGEQIWVATKA